MSGKNLPLVGGVPVLPLPGQPAPMLPGEFPFGSVANLVKFGFDDVAPPSTLYIQRDDVLLLSFLTGRASGDTVTFNIRLLKIPEPQGGQPSDTHPGVQVGSIISRGQIVPDTQTLTFNAGGASPIKVVSLQEGYLLSISAVSSNALVRGVTFARASIARGGITSPFISQTLFADYVTTAQATGYPGGRIISSVEGPGNLRSVQVANPAAGADWILVVPPNTRWAVRSFSATLTASAAVANRQPTIIVDDAVNTVWQDDVTANITAAQVVSVNGSQTSAPAGIITTTQFVVLPPGLVEPALWRVRSLTTNIQAGDQWSNIWFNVEEWIDQI